MGTDTTIGSEPPEVSELACLKFKHRGAGPYAAIQRRDRTRARNREYLRMEVRHSQGLSPRPGVLAPADPTAHDPFVRHPDYGPS